MGSPYLQAGIGQKQMPRLQKVIQDQAVANFNNKTSILASSAKFVEYQLMDVERLKKQLRLMEILVDGCKKHPAYRAIRPATVDCDPCLKMWEARLKLNDLEKK